MFKSNAYPALLRAIALFTFYFTIIMPASSWINLETIKLKNGLIVHIIEQARAPVVFHLQIFKTGGTDDPLKAAGLAHFLEHMAFQDKSLAGGRDYTERMAELGAEENAFTSRDATVYHQRLPKESLKDVLDIEAKRMSSLNFTAQAVELEKQKVLEERRMHSEETPLALFNEAIFAKFHGRNSNARPLIGTSEEIQNYSLDKVLSHYRDRYFGSSTVLIAGDITASEVKKLSEGNYATLPQQGLPKDTAPDSVDFSPWKEYISDSDENELLLFDKALPSAMLIMIWPFPSFGNLPDDGTSLDKTLARVLACKLLDKTLDARNGPLIKHFVNDNDKMLAIESFYDGFTRAPGAFGVQGHLSKEKGTLSYLRSSVTEIKEVLNKHAQTISEKELQKAKDRFKNDLEIASDSLIRSALLVTDFLTIGLSSDQIINLVSSIEKVKLQDVIKEFEVILQQDPLIALAYAEK